MKYQYFTEKLVNQDVLDLTQVFPDRMAQIQSAKNIEFGLVDIVIFLKQKSQDFKVADQYLIDLDYGIREVVERYYKSIGQDNPFITGDEEEEIGKFRKGQARRQPVTVEPGKPSKKKDKADKTGKDEKPTEQEIEDAKELLELFSEEEINDLIGGLEIGAELGDETSEIELAKWRRIMKLAKS